MKYKTFRTLLIVGAVSATAGSIGACIACSSSDKTTPAATSSGATTGKPPSSQTPKPPPPPPPSPVASASASGSAAPLAEGEEALRPMDQEILDRVAKNIDGDKQKDAVQGRSWKVNLYKDAGKSGVNRLKIDLNRNDKWEEKWTFEDEGGQQKVKREVAPKDDENYTLEYRLLAGKWVKKK